MMQRYLHGVEQIRRRRASQERHALLHFERTGCRAWKHQTATFKVGQTTRRLKVANRSLQHDVMLQAVQNHTPDLLIVDEIGSAFCICKIEDHRCSDQCWSKEFAIRI